MNGNSSKFLIDWQGKLRDNHGVDRHFASNGAINYRSAHDGRPGSSVYVVDEIRRFREPYPARRIRGQRRDRDAVYTFDVVSAVGFSG